MRVQGVRDSERLSQTPRARGEIPLAASPSGHHTQALMTTFYARSTNRELLVFNASGVLLCVAYTISGMTFQAFGDDTMNIFFVIVLSYSMTAITGKSTTADAALPLPQNSDGSIVRWRMRDKFQL